MKFGSTNANCRSACRRWIAQRVASATSPSSWPCVTMRGQRSAAFHSTAMGSAEGAPSCERCTVTRPPGRTSISPRMPSLASTSLIATRAVWLAAASARARSCSACAAGNCANAAMPLARRLRTTLAARPISRAASGSARSTRAPTRISPRAANTGSGASNAAIWSCGCTEPDNARASSDTASSGAGPGPSAPPRIFSQIELT